MGMFDRLRRAPATPWQPPQPGACACETHVEALREQEIPRNSGRSPVTVGALLDSGALAVESMESPAYVELAVTGQRVGPLHWALLLGGESDSLYHPAAAAALDDCLSLEPGIERVAWAQSDRLLVGAPELCASGVLAALVHVLTNPRVRLDT